jgi:hypothetical protein
MAKAKKPCAEATATPRPGLPAAYYNLHANLHALLETVRAMQCYEDDVCTLLTQIQRTGRVTAGVRRELINTLQSIPALRLQAEMDACFDAIEEAAA